MLIPSARWHFDSTTKLLTIEKIKKKTTKQNYYKQLAEIAAN